MIELERAIEDWCRSVHSRGARREERAAELADHLHCEIEALLGEGHSEREAFALATERLGRPSELAAEHRKNRPALFHWCCAIERALMGSVRRHVSPRAASAWVIGISLLAAAAMLVTSWMLAGTSDSNSSMYWILAAWWVPFSLLSTRARERVAPERPTGA